MCEGSQGLSVVVVEYSLSPLLYPSVLVGGRRRGGATARRAPYVGWYTDPVLVSQGTLAADTRQAADP